MARRSGSKKTKRMIASGQFHIFSTFNNTIITITDNQGNVVGWASGGSVGFKGSRKSTPYAATLATREVIKTALDIGMKEADMIVKGPGPGRESAIRAIQAVEEIKVKSISDVTPVPHNGCRPPKKRRV